jgi:hypothetical protein
MEASLPAEKFFTPHVPDSAPDAQPEDPLSPLDSISSLSEQQPARRNEADTQDSHDLDLSSVSSDSDGEEDEVDSPEPASPTSEDGFGNEEDVDVAVDAYNWKIDHSSGHHRLRGSSLKVIGGQRCRHPLTTVACSTRLSVSTARSAV